MWRTTAGLEVSIHPGPPPRNHSTTTATTNRAMTVPRMKPTTAEPLRDVSCVIASRPCFSMSAAKFIAIGRHAEVSGPLLSNYCASAPSRRYRG